MSQVDEKNKESETKEDSEKYERMISYFERHKLSEATIEIRGQKLIYWILSREAELDLEGFVSASGGRQYIISEDVPEKYRYYFLLHEYLEFSTRLKDIPGRCEESLKCELAEVPDDERDKYVKYRLAFFERLVAYSAAHGATDEFMEEINKSLALLKLLKEYPL